MYRSGEFAFWRTDESVRRQLLRNLIKHARSNSRVAIIVCRRGRWIKWVAVFVDELHKQQIRLWVPLYTRHSPPKWKVVRMSTKSDFRWAKRKLQKLTGEFGQPIYPHLIGPRKSYNHLWYPKVVNRHEAKLNMYTCILHLNCEIRTSHIITINIQNSALSARVIFLGSKSFLIPPSWFHM